MTGRSPFGPAADRPQHPAAVPGAIAGPGGPFDRHAVIVDARHALAAENVRVDRVVLTGYDRTTGRPGVIPGFLIEVEGMQAREVPGSPHLDLDPKRRGRRLLLESADGLAAIVAETMAILARHDPVLYAVAFDRVSERLRELVAQPGADDGEVIADDPGHALQPDYLSVTLLTRDPGGPGGPGDFAPPIAYEFSGRINRSSQRAHNVVLMTLPTAMEFCARIMHTGNDDPEVQSALAERIEALVADGTFPRKGHASPGGVADRDDPPTV